MPHLATDVQAIGCDFLVCSAYKFFGPHLGILWGRKEILEQLEPYKVRPAWDSPPWSFETGTQSHEAIAGTTAAVAYFSWIGQSMAQDHWANWDRFSGTRKNVHAALDCLFDYEQTLSRRLLDGLQQLPGVTVQGITDSAGMLRRVPTVAFTHKRKASADIAKALAERNIFVWSGHSYALEVVKSLGLHESGGVVRVGPVHYNSVGEIDRLIVELDKILY